MAAREGHTLSVTLHERDAALPVDFPEEVRPPGPARWIALAVFAIVGATTILIATHGEPASASLRPQAAPVHAR